MSKKKNKVPEAPKTDLKDEDPWAEAAKKYGVEKKQEKEEEENPYKDYPGDNRRGGNYGGGRRGQNSGSGSGKNSVRKITPLSDGPHAPYNFVPIGDKVMEDPNQMAYSVISDDTCTGEIRYAVTAETPILVDSGSNEFYRNKDGKCAMPGSTMRGLVRSNLQILSFSDVRGDIDDYRLMYRAVAGGCLQEAYNKALGVASNTQNSKKQNNSDGDSGPERVKAGYIVQEGGKFSLYGHIGDRDGIFVDKNKPNYFTLNEKEIMEDEDKRGRFQDIVDKFMSAPQYTNGEAENDEYVPYSEKVTYEMVKNPNGKPDVCAVSKDEELSEPGFVLSTGKMNNKKAFYVIPGIDLDNCIIKNIRAADIASYQVDYNRKKNLMKTKAEKEFYSLPEEGDEPRPVFYIELGDVLYFGYTPHLRLFFDYSVLQGLHQEPLNSGLDFAKSMFGFSTDEDSGKSKVFFTDAVLQGEEKQAGTRRLILAEPKPTSYLEYLEQTDGREVSTYNSGKMRLRGVKQYWLHEKPTEGEPSNKEQVKSEIHPLDKGSRFEGCIRFQNLSKEELGLLLWSLELEKDCRMNIGKAKPYGYGRVRIDSVELSLVDPAAAYGAGTDILCDDPLKKSDDDKKTSFVDAYKAFLSGWLGGDIMQNPSIKAFFDMKSHILSGRTVEYMKLENKDKKHTDDEDTYSRYRQQNNPLPTVEDIIASEQQKTAGTN